MSTLEDAARAAALAVLRETLNAARPADRLRAAEAILRVTGNATGATRGADLAELSDQALLEIARGVHPREMGPAESRAVAVPSHAHTEQSSRFANPEYTAQGTQNGPANSDTPPPGLVTPDNPFLKRRPKGPKEDPAREAPRGEPEPWE